MTCCNIVTFRYVTCVAFSEDDRFLASASSDHLVHVWTVVSEKIPTGLYGKGKIIPEAAATLSVSQTETVCYGLIKSLCDMSTGHQHLAGETTHDIFRIFEIITTSFSGDIVSNYTNKLRDWTDVVGLLYEYEYINFR